MRRVARIEEREAGSIEVHAVEVRVVRYFARFAADAGDVDDSLHRIDVGDPLGAPGAGRQGTLELSGVVVEVEMAPSAPLRPPDEIAAGLQVAHGHGFAGVVVDVFLYERRDLLRGQRYVEQLEMALGAIAANHPEVVGTLAVPMDVVQPLILPLLDVHGSQLGVARR